MPNLNASFQGQTLIIPGAYYADNVSAVNPTTPPTTPPLIFIGYGYGGVPKVPVTVTDPTTLMATIRGGPCSGYVQFLTNPSNQVNGAQIITYINPGTATQSSLTLLSTGALGLMTMTSTNYGVPSNLLQATVGAGSLAGKKLTLVDGYSKQSLIGDNLGVPFQLAYTGAATSGLSYSVAVSGLNATTFTVTSPLSGESQIVNIGAGQFSSIAEVVEFLNGTGFWSAIPVGDGTMPATYLDATSGVITPVSGTTYVYSNITAALGSFLYFVNQYGSSFATAAASGSVTGFVPAQVPVNINAASFAGATSTPPTTNDYASALNAALTVPGWAVFCDSNNAAVRALLTQHVVTASSITNQRYRRGFTGSSLGDSVATTISNAQGVNALQMVYAYPGIYRTDPTTGNNVLWSGNYAAAAAAGMATGNNVALPLTNKSLVGNGLETLLTVSQINQLQGAGVMPIYIPSSTGVPTICSDITTWQNDNNPENCFTQQVACRFFLAYSMINSLNPYIGTIAAPPTLVQVRRAVIDTLNALTYVNGNNGVIAEWNPASLVLTYTGSTQTLGVTVNVALVGQVRFIEIYCPITPLNITVAG